MNATLTTPPRLFGNLAIELGFVTGAVVAEALAESDARTLTGSTTNVGQILLERGQLTSEQVQQVLRLQHKQLLTCRLCNRRMNVLDYNPDKAYHCDACGGILVAPRGTRHINADAGEFALVGIAFDEPLSADLLPPPPPRTPTPPPASRSKDNAPSAAATRSATPPPEGRLTPPPDTAGSARTRAVSKETRGIRPTPPPEGTLTPPPARPETSFRVPTPRTSSETSGTARMSESSLGISTPPPDVFGGTPPPATSTGETTKTKPAAAAPKVASAPTRRPGTRTPPGTPRTPVSKAPSLPKTPSSRTPSSTPSTATPATRDATPSGSTTKTGSGAGEKSDPLIGKRLGGYLVRRKIGEGGMASVYEATNLFIDKPVALKVLPRRYAKHERLVRRFFREARLAAALDHPNVVPVWDVGQQDDTYYIAMQYVDGRSMKDDLLARRYPYTPKQSAAYYLQALDGLAAAHAQGIIHRDIKPDNFLITHAGVLSIADFGIARAEDESDLSITMPGQKVGTPQFMAPELVLESNARASALSDLYAIGVCLYFTTTGRFPYTVKSHGDAIRALINGSPTDIADHLKDAPEGFCDFVMSLIARDPTDRPPTAEAAREALAKIFPDVAQALTGRPDTRHLPATG